MLFDKQFLIIKPQQVDTVGRVIEQLTFAGLSVTNVLMQKLDHNCSLYFGDQSLQLDNCIGIEVMGKADMKQMSLECYLSSP